MGRFFFVFLLLSACTTAPVLRPVSHPRASVTPGGEAPGVVASAVPSSVVPQPSSVPGVMPTPAPVASGPSVPLPQPSVVPSSGALPGFSNGGGGGGGGSAPQPTPTPRFYIRDVVLTDTGESVMGGNAPAAIQPTYSDPNPIRLTVTGNFDTALPFSEPAMRFTFEPGLLHQTFAGDAPAVRAVLNGVLLLEAVTVTPQRLELLLPQTYVPDLQITGLQTFSLIAGTQVISVPLRFSAGVLPGWLPRITGASQIVQDNQSFLQLQGESFFLESGFNQCSVAGQSVSAVSTNILTHGGAELWLDLNEITLPVAPEHEIRCQTPRGITSYTWVQED